MKYAIVLASLIAAATADSVASTVLAGLTTSTTDLESTINAYNGGDGADLKSKSEAVVSEIKAGDAKIVAAPELTQEEAIALIQPVTALGKAVTSAVDAITNQAKKDLIVKNCQGPTVEAALKAQQSASSQLSSDLKGKVPSALQGSADTLAKPIADALASGVAAYADATLPASCNGGGAATSTGPAPTSSAPTTSAPVSSGSSVPSSAVSSASSSAAPATTPAGNATTPATTSPKPTSPLVTGAADKLAMSAGVAGLAMLAVLAL